jgi:hypothetical protein
MKTCKIIEVGKTPSNSDDEDVLNEVSEKEVVMIVQKVVGS